MAHGERLGIRALGHAVLAAGLVLAAVAMAVTAVAVGPAGAASPAPGWAKVRFDAGNTAFNPSETSLSRANVASLAEDWSTPVNRHTSPVVADGVVYVSCERTSFCALDAATGAVRWRTVVGNTVPPLSAALVGSTIFVGASRPPTVYALDTATGAVTWQTLVANLEGSDFTTPTIVADGLVLQGIEGFLFAWDAATGIQRWVVPFTVRAAPAVVNGVVYIQATDNQPSLYALRATTGETVWRSDPNPGYLGTSPVVTAGLVIVASPRLLAEPAGSLTAYPAAGCGATVCRPVWTYLGGHSPRGDGAVAGGVLYQGFAEGDYAAIEVATGRFLWRMSRDAADQLAGVTGPPTVANGLVFANGNGGKVYAWSAEGCGLATCPALWTAPAGLGSNTANDVVVVRGRLYLVDDMGNLHAYSARQSPPPPLAALPPVPPAPPPPPVPHPTIRVPADVPGIQRAIDASRPGDVVVVAPGVYHERLDFHGRAVEVRSSAGPETTVVDGDGVSTVVAFQTRETRASVLRGFTIRRGVNVGSGGGILVKAASPTIVGNVITGNQAIGGNGIEVSLGAPLIQDNQVRDNHPLSGSSGGSGGAIELRAESGTEVRGNLIEGNSTQSEGGGIALGTSGSIVVTGNVIRGNVAGNTGGGLSMGGEGSLDVVQNVIVGNSAGAFGGGIYMSHRGPVGPQVVNNTIARNSAATGSAFYSGSASPGLALAGNILAGPAGTSVVACDRTRSPDVPSFDRNDIFNGGPSPAVDCGPGAAGSSVDPRFVDGDAGDYRLASGSPAVDAGDNGAPSLPATDITGAARVVDGNGDGVATVDQGAYEGRPPLPDAVAGLAFHTLTPVRLLDTRSGSGAPVGPASTLTLQVTGRGGVPASGVSAVALNVTVTQPTAVSFLTAWPAGTARPLASNLNYVAGQTVPNLVVVKVGDGGRVSLYNNAGSVHMVADVAGWYGDDGSTTGARFSGVTPARILDTRTGLGWSYGPLSPTTAMTMDLQVAGRGGVPATGVSAVVLNVTVTETTAVSYLTAWPAREPQPLASNLNYVASQTVPNLVVVKLGSGGQVSLYNNAGSAHVVVDVAGWYGEAAASRFTSVLPARILDTRDGSASVGQGSSIDLQVGGRGGVPPAGVSAVVLNVTVTQPTATSFLTAWPSGAPRPLASNLNYVAGQTVPNLVVVKVGAGGRISLYNNLGSAHVIVDVAGWFG